MINLLSRLFIKNSENVSDPTVRRAYGTLCSIVGIVLNIILFAGKYLAGVISGSVAITADAFNNLSDAGSSIITLLGFAVAGKKPDPDHPFGHGRAEYLAGLALSLLILLMGVELFKSSVEKIIHPEPVEFAWLPAAILIASILVKVYMCIYNRAVGKKISSAAMQATATDSLSDSIATIVALVSMIVGGFLHINIDGYAGILVACFILLAGWSALKDTLTPLMGQAPDPEFVQSIEDLVLAHEEVQGIHDLIVHDYGPGRVMISLHAEVPGSGDIFALHDVIDCIERELCDKLGCPATIHMDPIETDDPHIAEMRASVAEKLLELDPDVMIHDFRMVPGTTHTNLIFDVVMPYSVKMTVDEFSHAVKKLVSDTWPNHFAVVTVDRPFVK